MNHLATPRLDNLFHAHRSHAGPDDEYYLQHLTHLITSGQFRNIFANRIQRDVIAMYLGVLSTVEKDGDIQLTTTNPLTARKIVGNLMRNYGIPQEVAEDFVSDTFGDFVETIPTDDI